WFDSFPRKREVKRRSLIDSSFRPNSSTVPLHNPLDNGETYAGSFELICGVEPLEHTEQLVAILHVEPRAVVFNVIRILMPSGSQAAELDESDMRRSGELDCVRQQIHEYLPYHGPVAADRGKRLQPAFELAIGRSAFELVENRPGELVHIDARRRHRIACQ